MEARIKDFVERRKWAIQDQRDWKIEYQIDHYEADEIVKKVRAYINNRITATSWEIKTGEFSVHESETEAKQFFEITLPGLILREIGFGLFKVRVRVVEYPVVSGISGVSAKITVTLNEGRYQELVAQDESYFSYSYSYSEDDEGAPAT